MTSRFRPTCGVLRTSLLGALVGVGLSGSLTGCMNPLYWFVQARKLYVSVSSTHALYVLDRSGLRSTWQQVWLSDAPGRMAYVPNRREILVLEPAADALAVVSPDSNSVVATIGTGGPGTDVAASADGTRAFVTDSTDQTVVRINLQTRQVEKTFSYAAENFKPVAIACAPAPLADTYVVSATGHVSIIRGDVQDASTFALPNAVQPARIVAGNSQDFYVTDSGAPNLYHITNLSAPVVTQIPVEGSQGSPYGATVSADGTVYLTIPAADKIVQISASSHQELPFATGGSTPRAIAADSSGIYIADEGSNRVVAMVFSGANLLEPQVMDNLPGPPVDLLAI